MDMDISIDIDVGMDMHVDKDINIDIDMDMYIGIDTGMHIYKLWKWSREFVGVGGLCVEGNVPYRRRGRWWG